MEKLTQEVLKRLLQYDPNTGIFTNRVSRGPRVRVGETCGCLSHYGYLEATIRGRRYKLHRLAFLYMEGYMPEYEVDHKNGIRDDNRWCNLRHVSHACNLQNCKGNCNNTSGFTGVSFDRTRKVWKSQVRLDYSMLFLGRYDTPLDAALARLTWEVNCPQWSCNSRDILVQQIQRAWPQFNLKSAQ